MWRLLLILSLLFQPLTLLRMDCAGLHGRPAGIATGIVAGGCCASDGPCSVAPPLAAGEGACCSGTTICNCAEKHRDQPAPAPSRTAGIDQVLVALQLPKSRLHGPDGAGSPMRLPAMADVLLPAMAAPQAFFCVWLT